MTAKSGNESISLTGPAVGVGGTAGHLPSGYKLQEFQIDRVIGEGGFSVVYAATDTRLERQVAIKEYMPTALATRNPDLSVHVRSSAQHREAFDAGLRSFVNEAKLLARFEHRALVKVHQFWQEKGTAYMVMPLYSGPTLKTWIKQQHAPVDAQWLVQFLRLVMDALETLHKENCLHRDVAPDNILILNERLPLLLDFGAARRVIGDLTQALTVILKPGFAPIEQYAESHSMRQGPWTDVYALCAVAHFMITGRAPTPSVTRVLADDLVPLRTAAEGRFPPAFLAALDAGLTVRPQQRPQSIAALRALMDGASPDDTLTAPPATRITPVSEVPPLVPPPLVPTTVRPTLPRMAEPGSEETQAIGPVDDDEKTRVVTARDLALRTGTRTISSPDSPALAPVDTQTAPQVPDDPTFASRFPSRSMREHETAVVRDEIEDDDRGSRLPLIIGGVAIAVVIGIAWAVISWLDGQIAESRRPAPAISPVPAPAPVPKKPITATAPPAATTPAQAPVGQAPPAATTPPAQASPPATAPASAPPVIAAATPPAPAPTTVTTEPTQSAASKSAPSTSPAAPASTSVSKNTAPAKAPPTTTTAPAPTKPASAPMQVAAAPAPTTPAKAAAPAKSEPRSPATASTSKSGSAPASARPTTSQPATAPYTPPPGDIPQAPAGSSTAPVVKVDVSAPPPTQVAAIEPSRASPAPAPLAELKAISRPTAMFPSEAVRARVDKGRVMARLFIAPDGSVSKVEILSAYPARVFDREVRETAMRWRYEAPGQQRQADVEFLFDRFKER